ncbi:unnamed protein product [Debaryomyces tyrocola]|nr:unnamed protein product [Debaryomyces tyrocola]
MVLIGITKRGPGFIPAKPSPLSNRNYKMSEDYGKDDAGRKQPTVNRQPGIRHKQGERRETGKNIGEFEGKCKNDIDHGNDFDGEQDKGPGEFLDILQTFPLFKQAPESFVMKIVSQLRFKVYRPKEYVIRKGEPSESMYWIMSGTVGISDGESIQAELGRGSFFGEVGVIFNRPRTATVVARSKVVVGVLESEALNFVLQYYPSIERKIRDEAQGRLALQDKKCKSGTLRCNQNNSYAGGYGDELQPDSVLSPRFLKDFSLFQQMPTYIIEELLSYTELVKIPLFDYVFSKGDKDLDVYFIVSGRVEIINKGLDSKSGRRLAVLESGRSFGILSFLSHLKGNNDCRRTASAISISPVRLLKIQSCKLKVLCKQFSFIIDELEHESLDRTFLVPDKRADATPNSPPTTRLSIDFLMNGNEDNFSKVSNHSQKDLKIEQLLSYPTYSSRYQNVSPISPISPVENIDSSTTQSPNINTTEQINTKKRKLSIEKYPLDFFSGRASTEPTKNEFVDHDDVKLSEIPNDKKLKLNKNEESLLNTDETAIKIFLKVFEYLTIPELMKLRRVCKQWNDILSTAPGLCNKLDLTPWNTSIDDKSLISITDFVGARPQYIDISNCFHVTDEGFTYMINEIGISGKIKDLKMESNWEISGMAIMDLSLSIVGRHLERIDLANCRKVRDDVLERLTGWNPGDINQTNNELKEDDKRSNVGCKNLKIIDVGYCKHLTDNIMYHISQNANTRLESLNLTRCTTITDHGFEHWNKRSFPSLKKLSLKDCTFLTDKSIISIANSASNLEILDLKFCCALSDVSIDMLCLGCPKLKHLDLSFCGSAVSDFSLVAISLHLRFLEKLILKGCIRVTRAGIDSLLSGCSPLNYLNISQCKNAHLYPGGIAAQKLKIHSQTKTAFVTAGSYRNIIEIAV